MLDQIEVTGFFFISGYLYRDNGSDREWWTGKIRRLLIPFLFFGLLYAFAEAFCQPAQIAAEWKAYLIHLYLAPVNYPLWFIRALFWMMLLQRCLRNRPAWIPDALTAGIIGIMMLTNGMTFSRSGNIFVQMLFRLNIACAITAYPFFRIGQLMAHNKAAGLMQQGKTRWYVSGLGLILWAAFAHPNVHLHVPSADSWTFLYISAAAGCMTLLLLLKDIPQIPFFNFMGQHSLIVLGTHAIFINLFRALGVQSAPAIACLTMAAMPPTIFLLQRYLPLMVGEKRI